MLGRGHIGCGKNYFISIHYVYIKLKSLQSVAGDEVVGSPRESLLVQSVSEESNRL